MSTHNPIRDRWESPNGEAVLLPRQRVLISGDGDGAEGSKGTIRRVYKSGRCCVDLDRGGFRNLHPSMLKVIE